MAREKIRLRYLPAALEELGPRRSSVPLLLAAVLGALFGGLLAFPIVWLFGVFPTVLSIAAMAVLFALVASVATFVFRSRRQIAHDPEFERSWRAVRSRSLPDEALAALEACALHRHRVREAARDLAGRGLQWAEIAADAMRSADDSFERALRLCAPLARSANRDMSLAKAMAEALDGDFDDIVEVFTQPKDSIRVDTSRLPDEIVPIVAIANEIKRLATGLEDHRSDTARTGRRTSETDEILERLRLTREAEQELHRDVNA